MARFYSNENFPWPVVMELRRAGHDVLTSNEAGRANQGIRDDQVLAYATQQNRAVLTLNRRDFIRLHQQGYSHGGIVVCSVDTNYAGQATAISAELVRIGELGGKLLRIHRTVK